LEGSAVDHIGRQIGVRWFLVAILFVTAIVSGAGWAASSAARARSEAVQEKKGDGPADADLKKIQGIIGSDSIVVIYVKDLKDSTIGPSRIKGIVEIRGINFLHVAGERTGLVRLDHVIRIERTN
jgi:hypothetical protein